MNDPKSIGKAVAESIAVECEKFAKSDDVDLSPYGTLTLERAAFAIRSLLAEIEAMRPAPETATVKFGCHCDLEEHMEPDGCVIDTGRRQDCVYARRVDKKENCEYWQPIKVVKQP